MYYCDDSIPLEKYREGTSENRKVQSKNSTFDASDESTASSQGSSKKESFLPSMGPLMQDFLFLKKIAFSPDVAANMLGNSN